MVELVWKDEYGIGHFQTDHEHKELISLANKVIISSTTDESVIAGIAIKSVAAGQT